MFDETFDQFKKVIDYSSYLEYWEKYFDKGITDVTSYDPLFLPDYYWEFYYVPLNEWKYKWNYKELNEIRWVLDYPYFFEKVKIDELFAV